MYVVRIFMGDILSFESKKKIFYIKKTKLEKIAEHFLSNLLFSAALCNMCKIVIGFWCTAL